MGCTGLGLLWEFWLSVGGSYRVLNRAFEWGVSGIGGHVFWFLGEVDPALCLGFWVTWTWLIFQKTAGTYYMYEVPHKGNTLGIMYDII